MNLSVNKPVKDLLQNEFHQWYCDEVAAQDRGSVSPINLSPSVTKPLGATWLKKSLTTFRAIQKSSPTDLQQLASLMQLMNYLDKNNTL